MAPPVLRDRRAGILLPVASLPGPGWVGDLGRSARDLVGWLDRARHRIWQILPLTVVDGHGCPYASPTAFAKDPLYLSIQDLVDDGFLLHREAPDPCPDGPIRWQAAREAHADALLAASTRIAATIDLAPFLAQHDWVAPWAHFAALRERHGGFWPGWPPEVRDLPLDGAALARSRLELREPILRHVALQWALHRQWRRLRTLARSFDIELWGDLPFFVGLDSADVWQARHLFDVEPDGRPRTVSGVPPDAFSADGQMWGHPQFDRAAQEAEDWRWWCDRVRAAAADVDVLRIDHFRGLHEVWEVPAGDPTAANGRWIPGPGAVPLERLVHEGVRLMAEDLGVITEEVHALRDQAGLPGMAVLQFCFGPGGEAGFLPHRHQQEQVVYTGTHDNPTTRGWASTIGPSTRGHLAAYLGPEESAAALKRAAYRSVAAAAILPAADLLDRGDEARINTPGTIEGNWEFRLSPGVLDEAVASKLRHEALLSGRGPEP